jgi:hypothetical protein
MPVRAGDPGPVGTTRVAVPLTRGVVPRVLAGVEKVTVPGAGLEDQDVVAVRVRGLLWGVGVGEAVRVVVVAAVGVE